jgi:hypothetical protein
VSYEIRRVELLNEIIDFMISRAAQSCLQVLRLERTRCAMLRGVDVRGAGPSGSRHSDTCM